MYLTAKRNRWIKDVPGEEEDFWTYRLVGVERRKSYNQLASRPFTVLESR